MKGKHGFPMYPFCSIRKMMSLNDLWPSTINDKSPKNLLGTKLQLNWSNKYPQARGPANNVDKGKQVIHPRWHNQLDPNIKKYEVWSEEEINKLFRLQN